MDQFLIPYRGLPFEGFQLPATITNLKKHYFQDLQFFTISPLAFTMALELIVKASKWVLGGKQLKFVQWLALIRPYMDDLKT